MKYARPLAAALLAACAPVTPPPSPESTVIHVPLSFSKVAAYSATLSAFAAESLDVAAASALTGSIESVPRDVAIGMPVTYRALVRARPFGSEVVLSGTVRRPRSDAEPDDLRDSPLHSAMVGPFGAAWSRLERIAARLRGGSGSER